MSTLLTYIDVHDGKIKRSSLEVLSRCNELAAELGWESVALVLQPDATKAIEGLKPYGPAKIYTMSHPHFHQHLTTPLLRAIGHAVKEIQPRVVAFASTEGSKDLLGALSAAHGSAALPDMSEFSIDTEGVSGKRPVMAAKILSSVRADGSPVFVSVRSGSYNPEEREGEAAVQELSFSFNDADLRTTLREIVTATSDKIDLSEAETVIAAGRGVKDEEGRALIRELADVLQAGVGASRALTEAGIYDPSLQIGQTGKVVSPQLYIGVGISGAIQHVAGMSNSKVIVAINKDPDAPIFEIADYGIVGDLYKVLPPFIDEIRRIKSA
jgi:electron transfer flavoprotein alpha subunit